MPLAKQRAEESPFSDAERKVQALASRRASAQLLRVPWPRFRRAYEEYPHWQSLALWTQAVTAKQKRVPCVPLATLRKYCPRFMESEPGVREPELLAFHLLEWIHNHRFAYAKRQGWLDALTFFGVRHPRSQAAWALWEHCDGEWSEMPPKAFPSFDLWEQQALQMKICGEANCVEVASAVEKYIDWEATALWLRPLFVSRVRLPKHVVSELEHRFPSLAHCARSGSNQHSKGESTNWQSLIRAGSERCLLDAKATGWPDDLRQRARSYPRHVRFVAYGKHWKAEWSQTPQQGYPAFRQWRLAADRLNVASANRSH